MKSFKDAVESVHQAGSEIERIIRNTKKDPTERKTAGYFERRSSELSAALSELRKADKELRDIPDPPPDHEYFSSGYFGSLCDAAEQWLAFFNKEREKLADFHTPVPQIRVTGLPSPPAGESGGEAAGSSNAKKCGVVRKLEVHLDALRLLLKALMGAAIQGQSRHFYTVNIEALTKQNDRVQELQDEVLELSADPAAAGFDADCVANTAALVRAKVIQLSELRDNHQAVSESAPENIGHGHEGGSWAGGSLPLPKIQIPNFNGDFLKWRPFFELFTELVDKQRLPLVQKLWYLRSSVSGDAEKLIGHLPLVESSYTTAWDLLQERYNNKRVIVAAIVQRLIDQPSAGGSCEAIKRLHDTTKECLLALGNFDVDTSSWGPMLMQLLIRKLDKSVHLRFEQSLEKPKELQGVDVMLKFLEVQFQSLEAAGRKERPEPRVTGAAAVPANEGGNCRMCKEQHPLYFCSKFLQLSVPDRVKWVKTQRLCFNCFRNDHQASGCSARSCRKCDKKHNSLLHLEYKPESKTIPLQKKPEAKTSANVTVCKAEGVVATSGYVLLATARIRLSTNDGRSGVFRAVLDSGSQVNIVSERVVKSLGASTHDTSLKINGVGSARSSSDRRVNLLMQSMDQGFTMRMEAYVLARIIGDQPTQIVERSRWPVFKHVQLADPLFHRPGKVDILLGAEIYYAVLKGGIMSLPKGLPVLQNTELGWIVAGKVEAERSSSDAVCAVMEEIESQRSLEILVERLWSMDEVDDSEREQSIFERQCEEHFNTTVTKGQDGRFTVRIPFLKDPADLGESETTALNRFHALEDRFQRNPWMHDQYIKFMREYESLGHMKEIDMDTLCGPRYFIPHHCVIRPERKTTKLRVVFDASCKTSSGVSLNDITHSGPVVQSDLFSILLRFRRPRFVFTTDVEKMYRQVMVHPQDRQFQLIWWRENKSQKEKCYQLKTVTYGTRSAPYLATKCLQRIATETATEFPLACKLLNEGFYVDDGLGGSDSLMEAVECQKQVTTVLRRYGFTLHKWCANNERLLQGITQGAQEVDPNFDHGEYESVKALGLIWLPKKDVFTLKVELEEHDIITKKTMTSDLARIFDPLGLLAPVTVRAKMFIQQLWQEKIDWRDTLPEDVLAKWETFKKDLLSLNKLQIPRHIFKGEVPSSIQLHVFGDASEKAYGAAAYIRGVFKDGNVRVQLLCCKTRVAPLKTVTLPRLELCAAVLAAQLSRRVETALKIANSTTVLWTDSKVVLAWINSQSSAFPTFIANRVADIQRASRCDQWRHVPSKENPADLCSRGLLAKTMLTEYLWFHGPRYLYGHEDLWPKCDPHNNFGVDPAIMERKSERKVVLAMSPGPQDRSYFKLVTNVDHGGSFRRLQVSVAYCLRFLRNLKCSRSERKPHRALLVKEMEEAHTAIMKTIQESEYEKEIHELKLAGGKLTSSHTLNMLTPFVDEEGVLRVGGRLEAASLPHDIQLYCHMTIHW